VVIIYGQNYEKIRRIMKSVYALKLRLHLFKVNPCLSNPCQNEGTCLVYGSKYDCLCKADYYGFYCEKC